MLVGISVEFSKADESGGYVRGFASVVAIDGAPVVDTEGDVIPMEELRKAAHHFNSEVRAAKVMHAGTLVGEIVESVLIDDEMAAVLKIADPRRGWWIGMRIHDEDVKKRVRSKELRAFSIHGKGKRRARDNG